MADGLTRGLLTSSEDEQTQWLPVSDLMAGLMMVFLFISVSMMRYALVERDRIKDIAVAYQEAQVQIYDDLMIEFAEDLYTWSATIDPDQLTFSFGSPEVLFAQGSTSLTPLYRGILQDFFPRYIRVLENHRGPIAEVRIEGHTDSLWTRATTVDDAYFNNMELSQGRTRSVLNYVYLLPAVASDRTWMKKTFAAVGLSSSKLVLDDFGVEETERSRRVDFRVITDSDVQIRRILAN